MIYCYFVLQFKQIGIYFDGYTRGHILDICQGYKLKQIFGGSQSTTAAAKEDLQNGPFIVYSSQGFNEQSGQAIISWSFECISPGWNDMIGVSTNLDGIDSFKYLFDSEYEYYMWWKTCGIYDKQDHLWHDDNDKWCSHDIITLDLNLKDHSLTFLKNGKNMFTIKNIINSTYYPVIFAPDGPSKYSHIVST